LDTFFINDFFQVSNEPGFLTPHLYTYAGIHDKTAHRLHQILNDNYHAGRDGLPGNDDSGAMGAWFVFNSMGFYPNAGQDVYLIGTPLYKEVTIHLPNGKGFQIKAKELNENNFYIESATLNGKSLNRAWLSHEEIENGGILELDMSDTPGKWEIESVPPSMSSSHE
jgi:putative alpha-1,2-mannosidase